MAAEYTVEDAHLFEELVLSGLSKSLPKLAVIYEGPIAQSVLMRLSCYQHGHHL